MQTQPQKTDETDEPQGDQQVYEWRLHQLMKRGVAREDAFVMAEQRDIVHRPNPTRVKLVNVL